MIFQFKKPTLVNLTPHEISICRIDKPTEIAMRIPPSGTVARVSTRSEVVGFIDDIAVRKTVYGDIEGLPAPKENTVYIVSTPVLMALKEKGIKRFDVVAPDTNPDSVVRDPQGRVVCVKYFQILE